MAEGADVIDYSVLQARVLQRASRSTLAAASSRAAASLATFYAQNGVDIVHPNQHGHTLIAAAAASYISGMLGRHARRSHSSIGDSADTRPPLRRPEQRAQVADATPSEGWESCYDPAERLPVVSLGGWSLLDDRSKGVSKRSLISRSLNQTLRLGPLPQPRASDACSLSISHLGYVLSAYQAADVDAGALHLSCGGCNCSTVAGAHATEQAPFPLVPTRMGVWANETIFATLNASIRASTAFWLQQRAGEACYLFITHHPGPPSMGRGSASGLPSLATSHARSSQVQVSSLALSEAAVSDIIGMWQRARWPRMRKFVHATTQCLLAERSSVFGERLREAFNCTAGDGRRRATAPVGLTDEQRAWLRSKAAAAFRADACSTSLASLSRAIP